MISVHQSAVQLLDDLKPVQFNWWFDDTHSRESSVYAVERISCKLTTILSSRPQHWQHFSPISLTWVQSDTLGFLCSFRHFSVHSSNKHAALTVYHLLETSSCHLSLSLCILRPILIFTAVISFSKLTASWSEASHKETTTYLHGYTSVLTVSLLNIDITRNRRLRTVVNDTYWLSTLYRGQYKHRHRLIIHLSYYHCDITTLAANLTFLIWGTQPLVIAIFFNATW